MGSMVHDVVEKIHRDLKVTRLHSLEDLLAFYHEVWEENWNGAIQISRKDYCAEDYRRLGEKCISDYYRRYFPFDQGKTLGLEDISRSPWTRKRVLDPGLCRSIDVGRRRHSGNP